MGFAQMRPGRRARMVPRCDMRGNGAADGSFSSRRPVGDHSAGSCARTGTFHGRLPMNDRNQWDDRNQRRDH